MNNALSTMVGKLFWCTYRASCTVYYPDQQIHKTHTHTHTHTCIYIYI